MKQSSLDLPVPSDSRVNPILLPPAKNAQVWLDFDGTVTQKDVLDELIIRFAIDESWKTILDQWKRREIGSEECLRREFELVRADEAQLEELLASIPLDEGFISLMALLRKHDVPTGILSDGIDWFIQRIVGVELLYGLVVRANTLKLLENRLHFACPHRQADCVSSAAHCKCASAVYLAKPGRKTIYIGDGLSDLCPSRNADFVFAKEDLAEALLSEKIAFFPFQTLTDVAQRLQEAWKI